MSKTMMCPGCGLMLPSAEEQLDDRYRASSACRQLYDELSAYTLSLQDAGFLHQFADVLNTPEHERNDMLREWAKAVWSIWESEHTKVAEFVQERLHV
jgi:hypothetical protein